jgi:hypothetical protein
MMEVRLQDLSPWIATLEGVRDAIMEGRVADLMMRETEITRLDAQMMHASAEHARDAVLGGRLMHGGHFPNSLIKAESKRAAKLYVDGWIGMPFTEPWVLFHTREDGPCAYLVLPNRPRGKDEAQDMGFSVVDFTPVLIQNRVRMLMMTDVADFVPETHADRVGFRTIVRVSSMRMLDTRKSHAQHCHDAASNILDPVLAILGALSTEGVEVEKVEPSRALNKARARIGKAPIPGHHRALVDGYVTALLNRGARRSEPGGGTHASPVGHVRRGHVRKLANGKRIWIKDMLVNMRDDGPASVVRRSHYERRG